MSDIISNQINETMNDEKVNEKKDNVGCGKEEEEEKEQNKHKLTYCYDNLLKRLFDQLNVATQDQKKPSDQIHIPKPEIGKISGKIFKWCNFKAMCDSIGRAPDHVASYMGRELCTTFALTPTFELKLKYKLTEKQPCVMFSKYINAYVRCKTCKGLHTSIEKDKDYKFHFIHCQSCLCNHTVEL